MFLRYKDRRKDGKQHRYWSVVENTRVAGGRVVQRHVLYLGEINGTQELAWRRSIEVLEDGEARPRTLSLFPEDRCEGLLADASIVRVKLSELRLRRPRQWGACWLALTLWRELQLDLFWSELLGVSRKGTRWGQVLFVLVAYRLLAPGSEWRLHREWFLRSALADLLGGDAGLAEIHKLYRCHDRLLIYKQAVFDHLAARWRDLFNISYDVLLYDLTSTYFEADPPFPEGDKRRFGYSRDHRPDCVQVVIALVVTPEGLPLAYEVLPGNTSDKTTLRGFLERIERQYGKARRVWLMDRGVPTEEVLPTGQARGLKAHEMRAADPPVHYLVGTPKGRLTRLEKPLVGKPWQAARPGVQVKLLAQEDELYVFAQSLDRIAKERAIRRRQLKRLWARLKQLSTMQLSREELLMKLGAARDQSRKAWRLMVVEVAADSAAFSYRLDRKKLRRARSREGRYLLRTNLVEEDPAKLWSHYLLLVTVEEAFKNLKGDLAIRPIFHQLEARVEAHIFIAFLAYCLHVTLAQRLHALAPGLTPRSVFEKFAAMQMIDVHLPTTDGRELVLTRYTEPEPELKLLLSKLKLDLPAQPPPKITATALAPPIPL
jgi:transposase